MITSVDVHRKLVRNWGWVETNQPSDVPTVWFFKNRVISKNCNCPTKTDDKPLNSRGSPFLVKPIGGVCNPAHRRLEHTMMRARKIWKMVFSEYQFLATRLPSTHPKTIKKNTPSKSGRIHRLHAARWDLSLGPCCHRFSSSSTTKIGFLSWKTHRNM